MTQDATADWATSEASAQDGGAAAAANLHRPDGEQGHGLRDAGSFLLAALRRLRSKLLSRLARWFAERLPAPLRPLASLFDPERDRGFGFWWLVATVGIAIALGLVVALLLSPVAALIALLVVAVWALVRSRSRKQDDPVRPFRAPDRHPAFP